jgi:hypothetical protein
MADGKNVEIDPRFDPAFQRGFDPGIPIAERVPEPLPRKTVLPEAPAPEQHAADIAPSAPTATIHQASSAADDPVHRDDPIGTRRPDASPSRNPFLLFLGIISIALIAAGIWLFVRSDEAFNSAQVHSQGDYMSLTATIQTAPFIALLGGATAIGVLFLFAARWRGR